MIVVKSVLPVEVNEISGGDTGRRIDRNVGACIFGEAGRGGWIRTGTDGRKKQSTNGGDMCRCCYPPCFLLIRYFMPSCLARDIFDHQDACWNLARTTVQAELLKPCAEDAIRAELYAFEQYPSVIV